MRVCVWIEIVAATVFCSAKAQFWMIFEAILIPKIYARLQEIASNFFKIFWGKPPDPSPALAPSALGSGLSPLTEPPLFKISGSAPGTYCTVITFLAFNWHNATLDVFSTFMKYCVYKKTFLILYAHVAAHVSISCNRPAAFIHFICRHNAARWRALQFSCIVRVMFSVCITLCLIAWVWLLITTIIGTCTTGLI